MKAEYQEETAETMEDVFNKQIGVVPFIDIKRI